MNQINNNNEVEIIINPYLPIEYLPIEEIQWGGVFYQIANEVDIDGYFLPELRRDLGFQKFVNFYLPRKWGMLMGWVMKKKWFPDLQIHFDEETVINRLNQSQFKNQAEANGKNNSQKLNLKVISLEEVVVNSFESLGEYLYQILELCVVCYKSSNFPYKFYNNHSNSSINKSFRQINNNTINSFNNRYFYDSDVDLFFQILMELKHGELYTFLLRSYHHLFEHPYFKKILDQHQQQLEQQTERIKEEKKELKKENKNYKNNRDFYHYSPLPNKHQNQIVKDECSKISSNLRKLNNPYNEEIEPHIFRLMQHSILLSEQDHDFKKEYYNPFLDSMAWMNRVKKEGYQSNGRGRKRQSKGNGITIWAEGDYLYYSQGKGKAKYILC